jgi:hypothetical protein
MPPVRIMKLLARSSSVPHTASTTPAASAAHFKLRVKSVRVNILLAGAHVVTYGLRTQSRHRPQPTTSLFSGMLRGFSQNKVTYTDIVE